MLPQAPRELLRVSASPRETLLFFVFFVALREKSFPI
jgi:hypothetical protein